MGICCVAPSSAAAPLLGPSQAYVLPAVVLRKCMVWLKRGHLGPPGRVLSALLVVPLRNMLLLQLSKVMLLACEVRS